MNNTQEFDYIHAVIPAKFSVAASIPAELQVVDVCNICHYESQICVKLKYYLYTEPSYPSEILCRVCFKCLKSFLRPIYNQINDKTTHLTKMFCEIPITVIYDLTWPLKHTCSLCNLTDKKCHMLRFFLKSPFSDDGSRVIFFRLSRHLDPGRVCSDCLKDYFRPIWDNIHNNQVKE